MDDLPEDSSESSQCSVSDDVDNQRVYLVPYRWWKEAQESPSSVDSDGGMARVLYTASQTSSYGPMKIINNIFNSDLAFNLRRENESSHHNENSEVGVSGRDYALVTGDMWVQALKWHIDSKAASKNGRSFSIAEDDMTDVYPLQLKLSLSKETESLIVKISKKDNTAERFRRACKVFCVESELLRIWDFAGRTNHIFSDDKSKLGKESPRQSEQEILLELQVYGLSDFNKGRDVKKDEAEQSSTGNLLKMNGYTVNFPRCNGSVNSEAGTLGLTGLQNLGNTCFMNSALQCLAHTPKVVDYFLGDYSKEINHENPLGMDGEIALAFGDLLRKIWAPGATPVPPRLFKSKLARFAPQFSGFNQHDSQELLAFLLDGLHEDVNRVKFKPYVEAKDGDGRPDEEVADEYWQNHLARNDSVIVDVCQGQYRSTLVCPVCRKVSITFDPFMYLSLPLPSTTMRTMTLTVMTTDGSALPSPITVSVPKSGKLEDLIRALGVACSLGPDVELLVAEVYNNRIIRYLEEPSDSLSLIRDDDRLVVYRLPKDVENSPAVVFMHQQAEENYNSTKLTSSWKAFGIPLIACSKIVNGLDVRELYLKLIKASMVPSEDSVGDDGMEKTNKKLSAIEKSIDGDAATDSCPEEAASANRNESDDDLEFYLTNEKGTVRETRIAMDEPIKITALSGRLSVLVCWPGSMVNLYKTCNLPSSIPQVFKPDFLSKRPQETVALYKCLEAFLKEEPLGPDDMWYCPNCKEHRQASKKLDLWRLPEVLVIHLKRFSYSRFLKNKLETFVDFPVHDLDLSTYMTHRNDQLSNRYMLYAISNHFGSMGGGHYTAFVNHGSNQWYDFDDSHVSPIGEDRIKTSAAYVLFYRRIMES